MTFVQPYSTSPGQYQFYRYYSFACSPDLVDDLARSDEHRGGFARFRVPLPDGQIFVVIEFPDGVETVANPHDTYEDKCALVPELFDTVVNPDAHHGGRITSVVPYTGNMVLYKMQRLRLPQYNRHS